MEYTFRPLAATSRGISELNPFGKSIRGSIGSEPWVGRSIAYMSGNPRKAYKKFDPILGEPSASRFTWSPLDPTK